MYNVLPNETIADKKLSYRRGTAPRAALVNYCCFIRYGS